MHFATYHLTFITFPPDTFMMTASTAFEQISSTSLNSSSCTHLVIAPKHWIKLPKDRTLQQHYTYLVAIFIYEYICDTFHSSHSQIHLKCSKIQFYVMLVIPRIIPI